MPDQSPSSPPPTPTAVRLVPPIPGTSTAARLIHGPSETAGAPTESERQAGVADVGKTADETLLDLNWRVAVRGHAD
jgi:hypothetical protein